MVGNKTLSKFDIRNKNLNARYYSRLNKNSYTGSLVPSGPPVSLKYPGDNRYLVTLLRTENKCSTFKQRMLHRVIYSNINIYTYIYTHPYPCVYMCC